MQKLTKRLNQQGHFHYVVALICILLVGVIGARVLLFNSHAAPITSSTSVGCTPNAVLVNPCRPLLGAAVEGDPHASQDAQAQFLYAEKLLGRQMDVFHDYHPAGSLPLNSAETYFADRANTYDYINYKPAGNWAQAGGSDASVNANIDKAAASIKSISPHKVFLTIWHEPENDVSPGTSTCSGLKGNAGSPAQYVAMWHNVENRFKAAGVTNVVWVMNYMGYAPWDCLIPQLWPGNDMVDWITYDSYSAGDKSTVANTIGRMYNVLAADSNSTDNFNSKPWGLGEWGDCNTSDQAHVYQYYADMKTALDNNTYPNLKMYNVYDDNGNNAGMGCLTDYSKAGTYDATEQADYNKFANDPIFTASKSTNGDTTPPTVSISGPANGATVKGVVVFSVKTSDNVGVKEVKLDWNSNNIIRDAAVQNAYGWGSRWNSVVHPNGTYTITATAYDAAGNHASYTITVHIKN